jgi:diguanylate cyclase (GGDEF)-like protein
LNQVLVGGLLPDVASLIERHLPHVSVHVADTGSEVLAQLSTKPCQLLVLDDGLREVAAVDVLRQLTESAASADVPVIYCLPPDPVQGDFRERAEKLGVRHFLQHPFEVEDLLASIAGLLSSGGYQIRASAELPGPERFAQNMSRRMDLLDGCAAALLEGSLDDALLGRSRAEARGLSGLMLSIGRLEAARLAREVELQLDRHDVRAGGSALRLSELVVELRAELERPVAVAEPAGLAEARPLLLLFDQQPEFADNVSLDAEARGLRFAVASDALELREAIARELPAVIVIDLDATRAGSDSLTLLGEAAELAPNVPVLVASSAASLDHRVAIARAGGFAMLRKPLAAGSLVDAVIGALRRTQVAGHRVLAVADDIRALAELKERLDPLRVELTTLSDARRFWDALEAARPDVVILDMHTSHNSGLELCRVLRGDDRWAATPVIILGEDDHAGDMHLAFLAGADDYVAKPLLPSELVARVANRLERHRLAQETAGLDPLTGLTRRRRSEESLHTLIRLAARYRKPFSLAAINVDGLREVNASCGVAAGDAALRRLGRLLRNSFRMEDGVSRSGGDQFLLGALGLEKEDCVRRLRVVAERYRQEEFRGGEVRMHVTFSAGVSGLGYDGLDLPSLQHAAEDALGFAKCSGGDSIMAAGWTPGRRAAIDVIDVALVERDAPLARLLTHAIEQTGWSTRWFKDADEATSQLCGSYPQVRARVILLEVDLSGRDGFAVLRALGRDDVLARTRVIMLTARANEPEVLKAFELGAFDHVAKPFSVQVLLQRIRRAAQS